jgi:hypothetical protein
VGVLDGYGEENFFSTTGLRTLVRLACSETLYLLLYPGPKIISNVIYVKHFILCHYFNCKLRDCKRLGLVMKAIKQKNGLSLYNSN